MPIQIKNLKNILVQQVHEMGEFFGFETRNKYRILDESGNALGYAAEQQKGFWSFIVRQYLGHWRTFDVTFFDNQKQIALIAHHPFRWFFERIEVRLPNGEYIGAIQKRFSILTKRFDVENENRQVIFEVASPIWKIWTFTFMQRNRQIAQVKKKWSGMLSEAFTDKDNFLLEFSDPSMQEKEKQLILASAVFIDLMYFEIKK